MAVYKCFFCGKEYQHKKLEKDKKMRCDCGSRIFFKPRKSIKKLKAV